MSLLIALLSVGCHKKTPEELLGEANELYRSKDTLSAEAKYEDVLKRFPESQEAKEARFGLSMCYLTDNDFEKGREELDKLIKIAGGPGTKIGFSAASLKLESYLIQKKPDKALQEGLLTSASLRAAPAEAQRGMQMKLAEIYLLNKKEDKAIEVCRRIIEQWPASWDWHMDGLEFMVRIYTQKSDFKKDVEIYQEYLNKHADTPHKPILLFAIGAFQKRMGETKLAEETFDASEKEFARQIEKAPGAEAKGDLMLKLAREQQYRGNFVGARASVEKVIKDCPIGDMRPMAKMSLADLAMMEKNPARAVAILQEVAKENPESQWANTAYQTIQQIRTVLAREKATTSTLTKAGVTSGTQPATGNQATSATAATPAATPPAPAAAAPPPTTMATTAATAATTTTAAKP